MLARRHGQCQSDQIIAYGIRCGLHGSARARRVICMISAVLWVKPSRTSSSTSPTCSALSNKRFEKWRRLSAEKIVSTGFSSGRRGGTRSRETLARTTGPKNGAGPHPRAPSTFASLGNSPANIPEMAVHLLGVRLPARMADRLSGLGTGRREQIAVAAPVVPRQPGTAALSRPDPGEHLVLPDSSLVLKVHENILERHAVGMDLLNRLH